MKVFKKYPLIVIILLYILANIFMLFNNGWFWDDWALISPEGIREIAFGVGIPFMIPIHSFLINSTLMPTLLYHIITAVIEILGVVIFYKSLSLLGLNKSNTFLTTLFFALLPYNFAKITLACFTYTIGFFFFLLGVLIFIHFTRKNNLLLRITSLIFFFCSFLFLPSTLVMALSFFLLMAVLIQKQEIQFNLDYFKRIFYKLLSWSDFILLPFVFWVFRSIFLKPTGIYAASGYREFTFGSVLLMPVNMIISFIQNTLGLGTLLDFFIKSRLYTLLFVVVFIMIYVLLRKCKIQSLQNKKKIFFIGLYLFIAGAFAYIVLGLVPVFDGYGSRHQILLRFGSAFLLLSLINFIVSVRIKKIVVTTILTLFIISTINNQLQFQKSWFKQMALEKVFEKEKLLGEGINFVVIDNTADYNEFNIKTTYAFYNYNGILSKIFGTQTRFAIDLRNINLLNNKNPNDFISPIYNNKDSKNILSFHYYVIIDKGEIELSNIRNLKMLFQYYFDKNEFYNSLSNILTLKILPYNIEGVKIEGFKNIID